MDNIFKHTSRSYYDVYNAFISAYPNKPTWIFKEMSGLFDFQSELMNRIATDILYHKTKESAYAFAASCDYDPVEADGATVELTITLNEAMEKTLDIGYQVGGRSTSSGTTIIYELLAAGTSVGDTISVNAKQKETITDYLIGTIENTDDFYDYPINGYTGIIKSSISLLVGSITWTRVDNFDNSSSTDTHFQLIYQSGGKARIRFGNGITGKKPAINSSIYGTFEVTKGLSGRLSSEEITINVGQDNDISSITNNYDTSGGNDSESISSIIRNSRGSVRLRNMIWSEEDLETAARSTSSNVQKAKGVGGVGSATIYIVPSGGGTPPDGLKSEVDTYVTSYTQFGLMPISIEDPDYVVVDISVTATIRDGFNEATVKNLIRFAMTLISTEFDNQVIEHYEDNGIDSCREVIINRYWAWAFTSDENDALEYIIKKWKSLLGTRDYREFGQDFEVGDIWIMGNSLYSYGVDIFDVSDSPSNITVEDDQIAQTGTVTVG
jgi:hypothetical protein